MNAQELNSPTGRVTVRPAVAEILASSEVWDMTLPWLDYMQDISILRRFKAAGHRRLYRHGSFVVDLFDRTVALDGELIALAPSELNVLMHLASKPGLVATFGDILEGMGRGSSATGRRALDTCIFRLRRRIERDPSRPDILLTEARVGYRLAPESVDQSSAGLGAPQRQDKESRRP